MNTLASSRSNLRPGYLTVRPGAVLEEPRTFSTHEIVDAIGVTARQLQWWDERGVIRPVHQGHQRLWSMQDAVLCSIVARLRDAGDSLQKIRKVIAALRTNPQIGVSINNNSDLWLIVGRRQVNRFTSKYSGVKLAFNLEAASDEIKTSNQYFLLIAVHEIIDRLEKVWKT
jgi:DNA-binding transcriptional MerR regulator